MILKFSFGIIFSITFLGLGNSILLSIKIVLKSLEKIIKGSKKESNILTKI